jgi:hypothetical protein
MRYWLPNFVAVESRQNPNGSQAFNPCSPHLQEMKGGNKATGRIRVNYRVLLGAQYLSPEVRKQIGL